MIEEDRPVSYKTKMKRVHSSKPLRVSLKDLDWVKKLKEKIVKKPKKVNKHPKMYISDRPAKVRKMKKGNTNSSTARNSFNSMGKDNMERSKTGSKNEFWGQESMRRDSSKSKIKGGKKKKKLKRESLNPKPLGNLKSGLSQATKYSTFEVINKEDKEMELGDLQDNRISVQEWYRYNMNSPDIDLQYSDEDHVLVGSTINPPSSDRNPAETTGETTPKVHETSNENPDYIENLGKLLRINFIRT